MADYCETCSHKQNYDNIDRCSYYHDSLCEKVKNFCKKEHYMNLDDGISLYALQSWLNRRTKEEMELPLFFSGLYIDLVPVLVLKQFSKNYPNGSWCFYSKPKDGDD